MKRILVCFCFVLVPVLGHAQGQAPNRLEVVQWVSAEDPARFACAHTGRSCEADWIKAVAAALHAEDARWGLNGKRGNPNDLSLDVVTFRIGPTDRHVQAFDICGACGGSNPQAVWNDITNWATIGQPGTAVWVKPASTVPAPTPTPQPVPQPTPQPPVDLSAVLAKLDAILSEIAVLRANHDGIAAVAVEARDKATDASIEARNAADRAAKVLNTQGQCYRGRFPKLVGSSEVTICPVIPE